MRLRKRTAYTDELAIDFHDDLHALGVAAPNHIGFALAPIKSMRLVDLWRLRDSRVATAP
jgi:hypothetical protein